MEPTADEVTTQGLRVLVVDDDAQVRSIVCRILEPEGYETAQAESEESARERLGCDRFDVVLTDLALSGPRDGIDLAALVHREFPETETILMTGYPDMRASIRAIRAGVLDFLIKPIARETLLGVVGRWSRERARREALQDANAVLESCVASLLSTLEHFISSELAGPARLKAEKVVEQARQLEAMAASFKGAVKSEPGGESASSRAEGGRFNG